MESCPGVPELNVIAPVVLMLVFMAVTTAAAETAPGIRAMVKKSLSGINREDDIKG